MSLDGSRLFHRLSKDAGVVEREQSNTGHINYSPKFVIGLGHIELGVLSVQIVAALQGCRKRSVESALCALQGAREKCYHLMVAQPLECSPTLRSHCACISWGSSDSTASGINR